MALKDKNAAKTLPRWKIVMSFILLLVIIAVPLVLFIAARQAFFSENPRFTLRRVMVEGAGYWAEHVPELCRILDLRLDRDNLFALDAGKLREKLLAVGNIEAVEVSRSLPDALKIRVIERIPRVSIGSYDSPLVADGKGVVMRRNQTMRISSRLPVLANFGPAVPGDVYAEAEEPLKILMEFIRSFPDFDVLWISREKNGKYSFIVRYRRKRSLRVIFPARVENREFLLSTLQSAVISTERNGENKSHFDVSFDGQVTAR